MNSLHVTIIVLLLGAFIPHSWALTKVATWEEFEPKMKAGGAFMLELTVENNADPATIGYCNKYPKVQCFYGIENLKDKTDSFVKHFHNDHTVLLIFYKNGVEACAACLACSENSPLIQTDRHALFYEQMAQACRVERLNDNLTSDRIYAALKKIS